jgi:hypothetical protein
MHYEVGSVMEQQTLLRRGPQSSHKMAGNPSRVT